MTDSPPLSGYRLSPGGAGNYFWGIEKKYFYHFILYNFIDFVTDMADWDLDYTTG